MLNMFMPKPCVILYRHTLKLRSDIVKDNIEHVSKK